MHILRIQIFFLLLFLASTSWASNDSAFMEVSFGESQLFIRQSDRLDLSKTQASVLPTTSTLLLGEWLVSPRWHALLLFNLPVSSQKIVLEDGVVVEERVSPYFGFGPLWQPFHWQVRKGLLDLAPQVCLAGGILFRKDSQWIPAPVLAGRLHLTASEGYTMYLGGSWTVGVRAFSLLYGVGHQF